MGGGAGGSVGSGFGGDGAGAGLAGGGAGTLRPIRCSRASIRCKRFSTSSARLGTPGRRSYPMRASAVCSTRIKSASSTASSRACVTQKVASCRIPPTTALFWNPCWASSCNTRWSLLKDRDIMFVAGASDACQPDRASRLRLSQGVRQRECRQTQQPQGQYASQWLG